MGKRVSKESILAACIEKQEAVISHFEEKVTELRNDAYNKNQSISQSEDRSAGKLDLLSTMEKELQFVGMEMGYLKSLNIEPEYTTVEPGAVVITDKMNFFIAVSIEKFEMDGTEFFGISTRAPIYAAMQGCKKGDRFEINKISHVIKDIY